MDAEETIRRFSLLCCALLAPELFPKPSALWAKPCLLGAALVPVAAVLRGAVVRAAGPAD